MAEYRTQDQVEAYLARIFNPDRQFRLYPFEGGWLVQSILTSEEREAGVGLGMTSLVTDSETGVVTEYPSWSGTMIVGGGATGTSDQLLDRTLVVADFLAEHHLTCDVDRARVMRLFADVDPDPDFEALSH